MVVPCEPQARPDEEPPDDTVDSGLRCRTKVWLERGGELALSEWRLKLLLAVDETGSLTQAAEQMDVPYRTAWYKLKDIQRTLGMMLLVTQSGGSEGGHSELTPEARDLLARFRRVTRGVDEYVEARFRAEFGDLLD